MSNASSFVPFAAAAATVVDTSVVQNMQTQVFSANQKEGITLSEGNTSEMIHGEHPLSAMTLSVSCGVGKKASRIILSIPDVMEVSEVLEGFNPEAEQVLSPAECVIRTLRVEEGVVHFSTTLEKSKRSHKVPVAEWAQFTEFLSDTETWANNGLEALLAQYPATEEAEEAEATEAAEEAEATEATE